MVTVNRLAGLITAGFLSCAHPGPPKISEDAPVIETVIEKPYRICEDYAQYEEVLLVEWYSPDSMAALLHCKDGKAHGRYQAWHPNGQPSWDGYYVNGKDDGTLLAWYPSGEKIFDIEYDDGKKDGHFLAWYENGMKWITSEYEQGRPIGTHRTYTEDGRIAWEHTHPKIDPYRRYYRWY